MAETEMKEFGIVINTYPLGWTHTHTDTHTHTQTHTKTPTHTHLHTKHTHPPTHTHLHTYTQTHTHTHTLAPVVGVHGVLRGKDSQAPAYNRPCSYITTEVWHNWS